MSKTKKVGTFRYRILALLIFATTINYFDRSLMGIMSPDLIEWFGWKKSKQFDNQQEWESYLTDFSKKINSSLIVTKN